ncbi:MAG: mechanosensitive ion channel domain-containing protein [Rhizomicrobium sp.]
MSVSLHLGWLAAFFTHLPQTIMTLMQDISFLMQCITIVVTGGLSFGLVHLLRPTVRRIVAGYLPRRWGPPFLRGCEMVALPVVWLALLWPAMIGAGLSGAWVALLDAATELLAAWICIRLLSLSVKSHVTAHILSVLVWCIVALSIFGLMDPLVHQLEISALHVGKFRLSALTVVHAIFALVLLLWLTTQLFRFLSRQIEQSQKLPPSIRLLLIQLLKIILPVLAVIIALSAAGVNLTGLTVVSGAVGLGIGLGLQKAVGNMVAGFSLLMSKSISPGDIINYKGDIGQVNHMDSRYVTLRMLNGAEHLIPSAYFLENGVENLTYSDRRLSVTIPVGISYNADPREAMRLAIEAARAAPRVLDEPMPSCALKNFGDNAIELEIYVSITDPENGTGGVRSDVLLGVWDRFRAAGIDFPYPQRDVHVVSMPVGYPSGVSQPDGQK